MIEGPRVQLPVECVDRNRNRTPPPPPPAAPLPTELAGSHDFADRNLDDEAFGCQVHGAIPRPAGPPSPPWVEEAVEWVCPSEWRTPRMLAEGPIVWVDPEPLILSGPVSLWLTARHENLSPKG
jgi:hypothetical protein